MLIEVVCSKCNQYLLSAPAGSQTFCPRCNVWIESEGADDEQIQQEQLSTNTER